MLLQTRIREKCKKQRPTTRKKDRKFATYLTPAKTRTGPARWRTSQKTNQHYTQTRVTKTNFDGAVHSKVEISRKTAFGKNFARLMSKQRNYWRTSRTQLRHATCCFFRICLLNKNCSHVIVTMGNDEIRSSWKVSGAHYERT